MNALPAPLMTLRRPRLLIRAARAGAAAYRRRPHLYRILGYQPGLQVGAAIVRLMDMEDELNRKRKAADAEYSVSRHVEVLSALMGEAGLAMAAAAKDAAA